MLLCGSGAGPIAGREARTPVPDIGFGKEYDSGRPYASASERAAGGAMPRHKGADDGDSGRHHDDGRI
jgi:hypothetical protein